MKTIVLTFDDACRTQLLNAVPVLQKYGFNATFFICHFSEQWQKDHADTQMSPAELKKLHDMGFEIANHSWTHPNMKELSDAACEKEIDDLTRFLNDAGIPASRTFAYPGGPYAENVAPILKRKGFTAARTTEKKPWSVKTCDPFRIPAYSITEKSKDIFYQAVALAEEETPVVILYHGIPEVVHPWCNTEIETFRDHMKYLADHHFRVVSFRDILG